MPERDTRQDEVALPTSRALHVILEPEADFKAGADADADAGAEPERTRTACGRAGLPNGP